MLRGRSGLGQPPPNLFTINGGRGLPRRTFKDRMTIGKGADQIDLYYFGRAHTSGDAWVFFPALRVLASRGRPGDLTWVRSTGDWLVLVSAHTWALYTVATRNLVRRRNPLAVTFGIMLVATVFMAVLFVGWGAFLVYTLVKFRARPGHTADYHGIRTHTSTYLEIAVAVVEVFFLIGMSIPVWAEIKATPPKPTGWRVPASASAGTPARSNAPTARSRGSRAR